jgi:hypothetical protein
VSFNLWLTSLTVGYVLAAPAPAYSQLTDRASGASNPQQMPAWAQSGLPGPSHAALEQLVGTWRVENTIYIAVGTRDKPAISKDIICRREWIAGGRYIRDVTEGTIGGGQYWRMGLLGYSNIDKRYEWITVDGFNTNMMIYAGAGGPGAGAPISMSGIFTDAGVLGEQTAGKSVGMRTLIRIESKDRHIFELYFTPPGEREFLADRKVYTRMTE